MWVRNYVSRGFIRFESARNTVVFAWSTLPADRKQKNGVSVVALAYDRLGGEVQKIERLTVLRLFVRTSYRTRTKLRRGVTVPTHYRTCCTCSVVSLLRACAE